MKAASIVRWTVPVPGREKQAIEYGREVDEFWGKQAADGRCSEPEWFWAPRGESYWIVKGDLEQLLMISATPESQRLLYKGQLLMQDFGYDLYVHGREEALKPFEDVAKELGYA